MRNPSSDLRKALKMGNIAIIKQAKISKSVFIDIIFYHKTEEVDGKIIYTDENGNVVDEEAINKSSGFTLPRNGRQVINIPVIDTGVPVAIREEDVMLE